jgi:hypothetical protein
MTVGTPPEVAGSLPTPTVITSQNKYADHSIIMYIYNITTTNKRRTEMSDIENAITDLIGTVVESEVDNALANNYDFQDLMSRVDSLESQSDSNAIDEEEILMRIAQLIVKGDPANRTIVYQTHIDNLKKEIDHLRKTLAEKEENNG